MQEEYSAKLLRVHCSEMDQHHGGSLYLAIVEKCKSIGIAGATVFRGLEGYGATGEIHRHHLAKHDEPIVITIIDTSANIDKLIHELEPMMSTGMFAVSDVKAIRIEKDTKNART